MVSSPNFVANLLRLLNQWYDAFIAVVQPIIDLLGTEITLIPGIDPSLLPDWASVNLGYIILGVGFLALIPIWIIKIIV